MDALIEPLVETKSLNMNLWRTAIQQKSAPYFYANPRLDLVMVLIVDPRTPKVTHFVDAHVALLYLAENREVVGFRIEGFEKAFLPLYADLQKVWRLSEVKGSAMHNLGDLSIIVRRQEEKMATELTRVARPIFERAGMAIPV
jgi:hypothetical protein